MKILTNEQLQRLSEPMERTEMNEPPSTFSRRWLAVLMVGVSWCGWAVPTLYANDGLVLLPGEIKLAGPQAYQTLLVEESRGGHYVGQVAEGVTFESNNPQVVT